MDIYAYHHTTEVNAKLIFKSGFGEDRFKKVSIGFGVQCFLKQKKYSIYKGKKDGQIKVRFCNCRLLGDINEINKSTERIQSANNDMLKVAKDEAQRLKSQGYNAYKYDKDIIVFLNYPEPIKWIPFENQERSQKSLKDAIIELAEDTHKRRQK